MKVMKVTLPISDTPVTRDYLEHVRFLDLQVSFICAQTFCSSRSQKFNNVLSTGCWTSTILGMLCRTTMDVDLCQQLFVPSTLLNTKLKVGVCFFLLFCCSI